MLVLGTVFAVVLLVVFGFLYYGDASSGEDKPFSMNEEVDEAVGFIMNHYFDRPRVDGAPIKTEFIAVVRSEKKRPILWVRAPVDSAVFRAEFSSPAIPETVEFGNQILDRINAIGFQVSPIANKVPPRPEHITVVCPQPKELVAV